MPQKAFIFSSNMAASESRDLVVMETWLTTYVMINIPWKSKWLWFKSLEDIGLNAAEIDTTHGGKRTSSFQNVIQAGWWNHLDTFILSFGTRNLSLWENKNHSTFNKRDYKAYFLWIDFIHSYSIIITYYFRLLFHLSVQLILSNIVH